MIEISHLVKKYGDHYAVKDLSFHVEKGQIYGFLGPNGAGKSTTMNIITGYLAPTSGEVKIDGIDMMKDPEAAKKKIGYLPEIPPVYTEMTVKEYLAFAAQLKKIPKKEQPAAIEQAMEMTGVKEVEKRLIGNLSKGYKQRVGLAQAVMGNPEVIILDEPTVGLDPKQIIEIRELIRKLGEKHTVILSSHILSEVSVVCDQIMILAKGELVACDTPEALQRKMQSGSKLLLTAKAGEESLNAVLKSIEGIESVECIKKEEKDNDDETTVSIIQKPGCDVREQLFFAMAANRMPILGLKLESKSLEDIFLQLTDVEEKEQPEKKRFLLDGLKKKKAERNESVDPVEVTDGNKDTEKELPV